MRLIDRYLFGQILGPTLLASAALIGVAILTESLSALDILVDQRQSAFVFVKIVLLAMPQLVVMILPVAVLVGAAGLCDHGVPARLSLFGSGEGWVPGDEVFEFGPQRLSGLPPDDV